jgi:hypothetical protein
MAATCVIFGNIGSSVAPARSRSHPGIPRKSLSATERGHTPMSLFARCNSMATRDRVASCRYLAAMAQLRVSRSTLGRLRADGMLRPVRLREGGWLRYRAAEIAELIERGRTGR